MMPRYHPLAFWYILYVLQSYFFVLDELCQKFEHAGNRNCWRIWTVQAERGEVLIDAIVHLICTVMSKLA